MRSLLLAALLVATAGSGETLLVNGSFEEGPPVSAFRNLAGDSTLLPGWVVLGEGIDYVRTYWRSSTGERAVDLDGSARSRETPPYAKGGIAQTFATTPGVRSRGSFDRAGNPNRPPARKPMRVAAAGEHADFEFDCTGRNSTNMGWLAKTFEFTARRPPRRSSS